MQARERRTKIADLAIEQEGIDMGIEMANDMLTQIVGDRVTSDTAQVLIMFNPDENVYISNSAPIVMQQPPPKEGEEPAPIQMIGMSLQFMDPMLLKETTSLSFSVKHRALIRAITLLRGELEKEQKQLDKRMTDLIK